MTKIEIEKSDLDNLIKEGIKDAMEKKDSPSIRRKRDKKDTISLRKVDDKFIVDIDEKYTTKIDPKTKIEKLVYTVYLGEEKKKKIMTFDEIRLAEIVNFKVIEKTVDEKEIIGDPIPVIQHKEWKAEKTGSYAENVVIVPTTTYKLKDENGEFLIKDNVVNL